MVADCVNGWVLLGCSSVGGFCPRLMLLCPGWGWSMLMNCLVLSLFLLVLHFYHFLYPVPFIVSLSDFTSSLLFFLFHLPLFICCPDFSLWGLDFFFLFSFSFALLIFLYGGWTSLHIDLSTLDSTDQKSQITCTYHPSSSLFSLFLSHILLDRS